MSHNTRIKTILILAANPTNTSRLRLDEEIREIQAALKRAKNRSLFEIVAGWATRVEDLHRALLEYQSTIVHFCGHGDGSNGLALENDFEQVQLVSTEALARLFGLFQNTIECVLLNACYSVAQAEAIHQHIDYVVGMNQAINVTNIQFQPVSLPAPKSIDIQAELKALQELIALLESPHRRKIDNAFVKALKEVNKPKPDKDEVGKALDRALDYAKRAVGFASLIKRLKPHLIKTTAWLGGN